MGSGAVAEPAILIKGARILAFDDADTELEGADILIRDGRIAAIEAGIDAAAARPSRTIEAAGMLALPGLVNGHYHSPGAFMKGALDGYPLEVFMLYEVPPLAGGLPVARLNYLRTQLAAVEMLKVGVTAVHDDAFHVPIASRESVDAIMQAYADVGMRATVAIDQPNVVEYEKYPFLGDLLPAALRERMERAPRQSADELIGLYRHLIRRWHGAEGGRLAAAVSCSAPQRVTVDYFEALSRLSREHGLPFNMHILETKLQRVLGEEKYGKSLVRYVDDLGLLDERVMAIHAIWVDEADIDILARRGCSVAHNPVCNLRLGSGVMPFRRLRDRGVPICLGSDESNVDDSVNMWGVAKMAGLVHTLTDPDYRAWPRAPEILWALIRGGARAMRLEGRIGQLKPGFEADLVLVDLGTLAFTPLNDLRRQLVYCENGSSVRMVMVAGRVIVEDGRVLSLDERRLKAEVAELLPDCNRARAAVEAAAPELGPHYRAMYLRAAARDVGFSRWLASEPGSESSS